MSFFILLYFFLPPTQYFPELQEPKINIEHNKIGINIKGFLDFINLKTSKKANYFGKYTYFKIYYNFKLERIKC
ncbi:MAG: hypothetical protein CMD18_04715 [Flavobacteriales bacterium]|nr:hypothetical protein [Flavobacteriales bacterium]